MVVSMAGHLDDCLVARRAASWAALSAVHWGLHLAVEKAGSMAEK